jgi:hypothetical protein
MKQFRKHDKEIQKSTCSFRFRAMQCAADFILTFTNDGTWNPGKRVSDAASQSPSKRTHSDMKVRKT